MRRTPARKGKGWFKVSITTPTGKHVLFLDPTKACSIVRELVYPWLPKRAPSGKFERYGVLGTTPSEISTVSGLWEPRPGVYYPKRVTTKTFDGPRSPSAPDAVLTVRVSRVRLNSRRNATLAYVVDFPAGATVTDEATGEVFDVGGTPQQQMKQIEKAVAAARKEVATQPARQSGGK